MASPASHAVPMIFVLILNDSFDGSNAEIVSFSFRPICVNMQYYSSNTAVVDGPVTFLMHVDGSRSRFNWLNCSGAVG